MILDIKIVDIILGSGLAIDKAAKIKQVFADEGYVTTDDQLNALQSGIAHFRGELIMTGQYWLTRFANEFEGPRSDDPIQVAHEAIVAAKKASGISNDG